MYTRHLLLLFFLSPTIAFADVQLKFTDGSSTCGDYIDTGKAYCRHMTGGDLCMEKSTIVAVSKVEDCSTTFSAQGSRHSLKNRDTKNGILREKNYDQQAQQAARNNAAETTVSKAPNDINSGKQSETDSSSSYKLSDLPPPSRRNVVVYDSPSNDVPKKSK